MCRWGWAPSRLADPTTRAAGPKTRQAADGSSCAARSRVRTRSHVPGRFSPRSRAVPIGGRSATRTSACCSGSTRTIGQQGEASTVASRARSNGCWSTRSSCSASSATRRVGCRAPPIALTDVDLASRLSFFLWSSIPDDELLDVGRTGPAPESCRPRAAGPQDARRSPGSRARRQFRRAVAVPAQPSGGHAGFPRLFAEFDENLRDAFQQETASFWRARCARTTVCSIF